MEKYPDYLYHYTSIETLALILKYKTIRLRRLDLADDPEESLTNDYGNLGRFCLVSCWTSMVEESLPMWQMYSKNMKGIRIKLPIFIFPKFHIKSGSYSRKRQNGKIIEEKQEVGQDDFYSYINCNDFLDKGYCTAPLQENILSKIEYTEEKKLLYPDVVEKKAGEMILHIGRIGKYKHKYWEFQQEFRYKIFVSPWGKEEILNASPESHIAMFNRLKAHGLPFEYIDLKMDEEKFKDMTIKLGPKVSEAERIIVQSLIKEYNPTAVIENSILKVR